jgi:hypothetical protein
MDADCDSAANDRTVIHSFMRPPAHHFAAGNGNSFSKIYFAPQ